MPKAPARILNSSESFRPLQTANGKITAGDFWKWAFFNLADNTIRGVLAEFIVGTSLGVDFSEPRSFWDDFDLLTPDGIRVEVKRLVLCNK